MTRTSACAIAVLIGAGVMICTPGGSAQQFDGSDIAVYGKECKDALGKWPLTWDCLKGDQLDVGKQRNGQCEKPPWLPLDKEGQCVDGAFLLRLSTDKAETDALVICRRYKNRKNPKTNKSFEDIAVIGHNNNTGQTCFFQARKDEEPGLDGSNVPSPMADKNDLNESAVAEQAADFWIKPKNLDDKGLRCTRCHDNDVWMHTPYVDQNQADGGFSIGNKSCPPGTKRNCVPTKEPDIWKDGPKEGAIQSANLYSLVEQAFFAGITWPMPNSVLTAKVKNDNGKIHTQECTACHRISDEKTKDAWLQWSTFAPTKKNPKAIITGQLADLKEWQRYRYMPQETALGDDDENEWHKQYDKHIRAMECCLNNPNYLGCASMPTLSVTAGNIKEGSKAQWGDARNGKCIDNTGDVALRVQFDKKVAGARSTSDNSCNAPLTQPALIHLKVTHESVDGTEKTLTTDKNGKTLDVRVPSAGPYTAETVLFPGDVLVASLDQTHAWDADHHQLVFERWTSTGSENPDGPACPCENPTSTTCQFQSRGASDWFGQEPKNPKFPGDPQNGFACIATFKVEGDCKTAPISHKEYKMCGVVLPKGIGPSDVVSGSHLPPKAFNFELGQRGTPDYLRGTLRVSPGIYCDMGVIGFPVFGGVSRVKDYFVANIAEGDKNANLFWEQWLMALRVTFDNGKTLAGTDALLLGAIPEGAQRVTHIEMDFSAGNKGKATLVWEAE
jgi:hypothetical protein